MKTYTFSSYGVRVRIEASHDELLGMAREIAQASLLGRIAETEPSDHDHLITLEYRNGTICMIFDGDDEGEAITERAWRNFFDTRIRLLIGEYAPDYVFLHAGVVAWGGRAIICPGNSFTGKSTLIHQLLLRGAEYLSDEYAILDADANVYPYQRPIALRPSGDRGDQLFVSYESLDAQVPKSPTVPALVVLTQYQPNSRWNPEVLSPGLGILDIIPHAISIRAKSGMTLSVLKRLTERAIIVRSLRGSAKNTSRRILDFVDKSTFLDTIT